MDEIVIRILIYKSVCLAVAIMSYANYDCIYETEGLIICKEFQDLITIHTVFIIRLILCYQTKTNGGTGRTGQSAIQTVGRDSSKITETGPATTLLSTAALEKFNTVWSMRLAAAQVIN